MCVCLMSMAIQMNWSSVDLRIAMEHQREIQVNHRTGDGKHSYVSFSESCYLRTKSGQPAGFFIPRISSPSAPETSRWHTPRSDP